MKKYHTESKMKGIKRRNANWFGHIWCWNCLLKHVIEVKGREDEEEDMNSH
jgi:hypothetical protein